MANKRKSSMDNPLVPTMIRLPCDIKNEILTLCEKTGKSMSDIIREWAIIQLHSHDTERAQLEREKEELLANTNMQVKIIDAQLEQLLESEKHKQDANRPGRKSSKNLSLYW